MTELTAKIVTVENRIYITKNKQVINGFAVTVDINPIGEQIVLNSPKQDLATVKPIVDKYLADRQALEDL